MCPTARTTLVFSGDGLGHGSVHVRSPRYGILDHRHISIILKRSLAELRRLRELRRMMKMKRPGLWKKWISGYKWQYVAMVLWTDGNGSLACPSVRLRFLSCCFNQARLISSRPVMTVKLLQQNRSVGKCGFQFHFGHWHHLHAYSTWFPAAQVNCRDSLKMCLEPPIPRDPNISCKHGYKCQGGIDNDLNLVSCTTSASSAIVR